MDNIKTEIVKESTARRAVGVEPVLNPNSKLGRVIAEYRNALAEVPDKPKVQTDSRAPTSIGVMCYRKAYPQEVLFQLEPVLRKAGIRPVQIIAALQPLLEEQGFRIFVHDLSDDPYFGSDDWMFLTISNQPNGAPSTVSDPAPARWMRPSVIIRQPDGTLEQGFRLHGRGLDPAEGPLETLFVPDHDGFPTGELVECRWDKAEAVWKPTGKARKVAMPWDENTLTDEVEGSSAEVVSR